MRQLLAPTLAFIAVATLSAGDAATLPPEKARIGDIDVTVSAAKDVPFPVKADADVASRELWYQGFDGAKWGAWQKLGQAFSKDAAVVWSAPEGHWRTTIRRIMTSELAGPDPSKEQEKIKPNAIKEFIIDRTAPVAAVTFPPSKAKLRGGDKYTVTWTAVDAYLRNAPITLKWSRDGNSAFETVAENQPNSGSFEWTVPRDMTTSGVLRIEVGDKAGNIGFGEVTSILVDSIKPKGRVVGPTICARSDVPLELEIGKTGGQAGVTAARLWISQDDGASWTENANIEAPFKNLIWKAPADGRFRLYIVATDGAGNVTTGPKDKVGDVLVVDSTPPTLLLSQAIGIAPAASAGPAVRRDFKPGDRVAVAFTAKDANLVQGSAAVYWQIDATKPWVELAKSLPVDQAYRFQLPADAPPTKSARIKVTAQDAAGNVGEVIAVESFAIQTDVGVDDGAPVLNP
ncbi:MAG: Ser-Thr-rich GPI-anchored membrane family protein [Planctomycetota bacterium]